VFTPDAREFYSLDKQWQDGKFIDITDYLDKQGD
jgi:ribosomal silencing factor RsfS